MAPAFKSTISGGTQVSARAHLTDGANGNRCEERAIKGWSVTAHLRGEVLTHPGRAVGSTGHGTSLPQVTAPSAAKAAG